MRRTPLNHPPYRRAATILLVGTLMACLFVVSYIDALGRPTARALDVAVVGDDPASNSFASALSRATSEGVVFTRYPDVALAERAVAEQRTYAVLVLTAGGTDRLELSTASGSSAARVLTQATASVESQVGAHVGLSDLHPLPSSDPSGLAEFYLTLAATIAGFVGTFQLRANAKPLPLRPWLLVTGVFAVSVSLLLVVVTRFLLGVPIPVPRAWLLLALQMATASAFAATMSTLVGRWALVPTWLLFVVLGNTSSGGAVAAGLLPEPFRALSRLLPSGATVGALRSAAYFPDTQPLEPLLVLLLWTVGSVTALLLACRVTRRSPGED